MDNSLGWTQILGYTVYIHNLMRILSCKVERAKIKVAQRKIHTSIYRSPIRPQKIVNRINWIFPRININFPTPMGSAGGWVFVPDGTRGVA